MVPIEAIVPIKEVSKHKTNKGIIYIYDSNHFQEGHLYVCKTSLLFSKKDGKILIYVPKILYIEDE